MMRGRGGHWGGGEPDLTARPGSGPRTLRQIAGFFRPYRSRLVLISVLILVTVSVGVVNPILLKLVIDNLLGPQDLNLLYVQVALMVVLPFISSGIGVGQSYLSNVVGQRVMDDLRLALYTHLQWMPLRFFTETRTGEIQSRIGNDVNGVQSVVTDTAASTLSNFATVATTVVAMLILDWRLTILSLGMLPVFAYITFRVGKIRRVVSGATQRSLAEVSAITEESLSVSGILLSKTFGQQRASIGRFARESRRLGDLQIRQQMIGRWFFALIGTFFSIAPAFVYLLAGSLIIGGDTNVSVGTIVAFTTLQSRLFFPLGQLLNVQVEIQGALALFDRIFEYLEMPHDITDAPGALVLETASMRGGVRFSGVSFRYPRSAAQTASQGEAELAEATGRAVHLPIQPFGLEEVDFEARPGELVALVGPSGSGKTTTTYLIPRLYDVQSGTVEIDGHDVRGISLESLGRVIGVVTQETYLFHASVIDNLRYAKPEATMDEVEAAARAAAIHDRITQLPEGYETVVGERGYKLSGGEKQRVAIARVLLKDPRILVLDEATSALDTVSERLIQSALARLTEGRTTIAIAHRLSTILRADQILVFDRGRIVERGTHAELVAHEGLYARLYAEQFAADQPTT
ncbi:MAG TPA: ABC transporter ATP-binding protein [Candidatus Limnocylindrales bacterium]|nr:ABC transporter ATP-binding protein [Candidatus Limnocylindrales bacterium]